MTDIKRVSKKEMKSERRSNNNIQTTIWNAPDFRVWLCLFETFFSGGG